jgi:heme-degrading monooxygenase HmoA
MSGGYSILELPVACGEADEFVRRFAELRIFELAGRSGGLRGARLLRPERPERPFVVVAEWDAEERYLGWLGDPERSRVNAELAFLLDGEMRGGFYEEAHRWPREDGQDGRQR